MGAASLCHVLLLLLAIAHPVLSQSDPGPGSWTSKSRIPSLIDECAGALVGDTIYIGGGGTGVGGVKSLFAYDPLADRWSKAPDMPVGLHHLHMAGYRGELYVLGGSANTYSTQYGVPWLGSTHAFAFKPSTGQWRALAPLPRAAGMGGAAVVGDRIYVIGGVDDRGVTLNLVQEYDPATDSWKIKAPMPTPREHLGIAVLDSLIYAVAGRPTGLGGRSLAAVEAYSPASDKWYKLPDLPTLRSGLGCAAVNGRIYAMGGEWPGVHATNEEYDPARNSWRKVKEMPAARHGFAAVAHRNRIYVVGAQAAPTDVFTPPENANRLLPRPPRLQRMSKAPIRNALGALVLHHPVSPVFAWGEPELNLFRP